MLTKSKTQQNELCSRAAKAPAVSLKENELACLKYMADGFNNSEIAQLMNLSYYTVRDRVSVIIGKLDGANRTEAVVQAVRLGLI